MAEERQERTQSEYRQSMLLLPEPSIEQAGIRLASLQDSEAVATVLVEAFPALYTATFGKIPVRDTRELLTALYRVGALSLEATLLFTREDEVLGLVILHTGASIGRGSLAGYWRVLRSQLGYIRSVRAFFGGVSTNAFLNRRIPHAEDLVYIEALAVREGERGKGIGWRLLQEAETWAQDHQRTRLALHVLHSNRRARRLYDRFGFHPWEETRPLSVARTRQPASWTAQMMVRPVSPPTVGVD